MNDPQATSTTVEVVYRGIFQKTLAQRICRSIVLAARKAAADHITAVGEGILRLIGGSKA